ncbi:MAG: hypothetical protein KF865_15150 [Bdellovibrionaceae bacterium]|nr:hypothetical protein [Pseudobdellovibrionaceae bacterium]
MKHLIHSTTLALLFALTSPALALEAVEGAKKDYQTAKAEVAAQLDTLDKKIEELKKSAQQKSTAAKEKALNEAQEARVKLGAEYERMKTDTESNWTSFKKKVARSLEQLNSKAQKALNE